MGFKAWLDHNINVVAGTPVIIRTTASSWGVHVDVYGHQPAGFPSEFAAGHSFSIALGTGHNGVMRDIRSAEDDRRDSPRVPMTFMVRDADHDEGEWEEREGDLSLGGISWLGKTAPLGREVDVRFRLPGVARELRARGEIIRIKPDDRGLGFQLRFTELETQEELAIAKYLDDLVIAETR